MALISFDGQPQIATDQVNPHDPSQGIDPAKEALNTIDADTPSSTVLPLPATTNNASFLVSWTGTDGASGIGSYDIYVAQDGGAYTLWKAQTTDIQATYTGQVNHTYAFYSVATDNVGLKETAPSGPEAFTMVIPANHAPVATNDSYSTNKNTPLTVSAPTGVLTNDTDADGDNLTAHLVNGPAHGTLTLNANGSFTYTPTANYSGSDGFTYKANDGIVDSNVATVALTVVNHTPVAANASYTADENNTLTVSTPGLMANGTDADGDTLTTGLVNGAAHGTVSVNANGSFTYTPSTGYGGADSFTYKANDGTADSNVATVSLTIVNHAPVATTASYTADENTPLTVSTPGLMANCTDADGDTLTTALVNAP